MPAPADRSRRAASAATGPGRVLCISEENDDYGVYAGRHGRGPLDTPLLFRGTLDAVLRWRGLTAKMPYSEHGRPVGNRVRRTWAEEMELGDLYEGFLTRYGPAR